MQDLAPLIALAQSIKIRAANSSIAADSLERDARNLVKTRIAPSITVLRAGKWAWEAEVVEILLHNPLAAELPTQAWSHHLEKDAVQYVQVTSISKLYPPANTFSFSLAHCVSRSMPETESTKPGRQPTRTSSSIPIMHSSCCESFCAELLIKQTRTCAGLKC